MNKAKKEKAVVLPTLSDVKTLTDFDGNKYVWDFSKTFVVHIKHEWWERYRKGGASGRLDVRLNRVVRFPNSEDYYITKDGVHIDSNHCDIIDRQNIEKQIEQSKKIPADTWLQKQEEDWLAQLKKEEKDQFSREHDLLMEHMKGFRYPTQEEIFMPGAEKAVIIPTLSEVKKFIEENEELIGFDQNAKLFAINLYLWIKSR